jgi:hypothetical protein
MCRCGWGHLGRKRPRAAMRAGRGGRGGSQLRSRGPRLLCVHARRRGRPDAVHRGSAVARNGDTDERRARSDWAASCRTGGSPHRMPAGREPKARVRLHRHPALLRQHGNHRTRQGIGPVFARGKGHCGVVGPALSMPALWVRFSVRAPRSGPGHRRPLGARPVRAFPPTGQGAEGQPQSSARPAPESRPHRG